MKKIALLVLCCLTVLFGALGVACFAVGPGNEVADKNLTFTQSDWTVQKGEWEFSDRILNQNAEGNANRIVLNDVIDQNYLDVSVDVKFTDKINEAGIEFRAAGNFDNTQKQAFVINSESNYAGIYHLQANRSTLNKKPLNVVKNRWYRLRVVLSGVSAEFYIDDELWIARDDVALKDNTYEGVSDDSPYVALLANNGGVSFRNFEYTAEVGKVYSWEEIVDMSDVKKGGYERFNGKKFEYPYVGLGKTTMLVSPYGFLKPQANRPGQTSFVYKNDPALIYDFWWDDAIKVTPFTFGGGYLKNGRVYNGEVTEDEKTSYYQHTDIETGLLTTELTLDVDGTYIDTVREVIVNKDGVVAYRITNSGNQDFVFEVGTEAGFNGTYSAIENGFVVESNLRKDAQNKGYLAVKGVSEAGVSVDAATGKLTFKATDKPVYVYLSPSSTLNEGEGAKAGAVERLNAAGFDAAVKQGEEIYKDVYSRSQISIPDKGMAIWYARSLFYMVVSMYDTRVPVGCYGSNPDGFFGNVCFEFDIMFQQLSMLYLNQTELSGSTVDWILSIKEKANELASEGYTDRYGNTLPELIDNGYLFAWLMGWDGSPAHGAEVGHERGWMSLFSGANVALATLKQAEYTDGELAEAKDVLAGQLRVLLSFMEFSDEHGWYWHKGIWTGVGDNYGKGDGNQNAAAVYSIWALREIYEKEPQLFTDAEVAELEGWEEMLEYMWPANGLNTWHHIGVGGDFIPTSMTQGGVVDSFGGIFPMILAWYNIYSYDLDAVTLTALGYRPNFDYFFNSSWAAFIAARAGHAEVAEKFAQYVLGSTCLYDDTYFCENAADGEDYKRAPETGAHGAYLMALSAMMFDGENEEFIKVFPAITEEWQSTGVSFGKFLATGNVEVSASFTNEKTNVTITNNSKKTVERTVLVRVAKGSGAATYNGTEYPIVDGYFAQIPVTIEAGETVEMEVVGIEKDVEVAPFHAIFPMDGSDSIRIENTIFHWSRSDTAASYELVISKNEDLSDPIYTIDMGQKNLYYPLVERDYINLEEGETYYWTAYGINGENKTMMQDGICSFKIRVETINRFGFIFESKGDISLTETGIKLVAHAAANDTSNVAIVAPGADQYTVDMALEFAPVKNHQQAGILLYVTDANYLKLSRSYTNNANVIDMKTSSGSFYVSVPDRFTEGTVYLKLVVTNGVIAGYFSVDGVKYQKLGETPNEYAGMDEKIGAFVSVWTSVKETVAYVNNFAIDTENYEIFEGETVVDETLFDLAGYVFKKLGDVTVDGSNVKIVGAGDEGQPSGIRTGVEGNKEITAKITYTGCAGMMIKNGASYQFIRVNGNNYESYGNIEANGGIGSTAMGEANGTVWLKIIKDENLFETYYSLDGEAFVKAYTYESASFAFTSYDVYIYANSGEATVNGVTVKEVVKGDPDPIGSVLKPVSVEWQADGNTQIEGGYITLTAPKGVWEDAAAQATITVKGHYEVFSKVAFTSGIVGIKISTDSGYQFIRIGNGKYASYGNIEGAGGVGDTPVNLEGATVALRILRKAALFEGYYSLDGGASWVKVYSYESENFEAIDEYNIQLYAIQGAKAVFYGTYVREFCKSYLAEEKAEYSFTSGASADNGVITVSAAAGVWEDAADAAYFNVAGDFAVTAKAKFNNGVAGVMIKNADGGYQFIRTNGTTYASYGNIEGAGGVGDTAFEGFNGEIYFKINKVGALFETYYSLNGTDWNKVYGYASEAFASVDACTVYLYGIQGADVEFTEVSVAKYVYATVEINDTTPAPELTPDEPEVPDTPVVKGEWKANGEVTYENGVAEVTNGGSEDSENYLGINLSGNYTVTTKISGIHYIGMQLRTNSGYMFIRLNVAGKTYCSYGNIEGAGGIGDTAFEPTDNMYLRIVKNGKLFETYFSLDGGANWTKVYSYESDKFAFDEYEIRLYSIGQPATFSDISAEEIKAEPEAPAAPAWTATGSVTYENGVAEVANGGSEDSENYLGINLSGNYTVTAKVSGIHYIGMQLRTNSGYMFIRLNVAGKNYCSYGNIEPNGGIGDTAFEPTDNMYLRMVKNGKLFETYFSLDGGANWTKVYSYESENFAFTDYEIRLYSIGQPATFSDISAEEIKAEPEAPAAPAWTATGSVTYENGVAEVTNGGSEDSENYLGINLSGNYTVTTKISGIHYIGMQLRTNSGYMFIRLNVAGKNYCSYGNIEGNGGIGDTAFEPTDNMYLRMVKNGNLLETYFSLDGGANWTKVYSYESENFAFTDYEIRLYAIGQPATFSDISAEEIKAEPEAPAAPAWTATGSVTYENGVAEVTNGGSEDSENYLGINLSGNYTVTTKISGIHYIGMQLRTNNGYMFIRLNVAGKNYCSYGNIEPNGGIGDTAFEPTDNMYLRVVKNGNLFETYFSLDGGTTWNKVYSYESEKFAFDEYEIRLYSIGQPATFSDISAEEIKAEPEAPAAPAWTATGSVTYENGVAEVTNGGSEDSENYLGINLSGNYTVTAKVSGIHYIGMQLRTNNGYMFIRLNVAGKTYCSYGNIEPNGGVGDTAFEPTDNMYLRVVKNGNLFETYFSLDGGTTWNKVYSYESENFAFTDYEIRLYSIGQPATFSDISAEQI